MAELPRWDEIAEIMRNAARSVLPALVVRLALGELAAGFAPGKVEFAAALGRLLAAGCCPGQVKTAKAEKRKIEARAIRKRRTLTSLRNNYHRPCSLYSNLEVR